METTIPSLLTARPSKNPELLGHQIATKRWWEARIHHYDIFTSEQVWLEASAGDAEMAAARINAIKDFPILEANADVKALEQAFLRLGFIPVRSASDALHLALATVHRMNFILTWNCTHINNGELEPIYRRVCEQQNYALPVIVTPEEISHPVL